MGVNKHFPSRVHVSKVHLLLSSHGRYKSHSVVVEVVLAVVVVVVVVVVVTHAGLGFVSQVLL